MDVKELRQKSDKEISELVAALRERLRHFRFETASDAIKDVREIREAKKTLARTLTISAEKAKIAAKAK
jgi:ribosomal protein L29